MKRYRDKAVKRIKKWKYVGIITSMLTREEVTSISKVVDDPMSVSRSRLKNMDDTAVELLKVASSEFGLDATLNELEEIVPDKEDWGEICYVPKMELNELLNVDSLFDSDNNLPPHARIGFFPKGTREKDEIEVFQLDSALFEDMAMMLNCAIASDDPMDYDPHSMDRKVKYKKERAYVRSGIRSVFVFLEGYMNCLGYDILFREDGLSKDQIDKLIDSEHLGIRDKIMQYPKIALSCKHPPIQENNCYHLEVIVKKEKALRHSTIHPRPHETIMSTKDVLPESVKNKFEDSLDNINKIPDSIEGKFKEKMYFRADIEDLKFLCDTAVGLVKRVEDELDGRYSTATKWLHERQDDGAFPKKAFS